MKKRCRLIVILIIIAVLIAGMFFLNQYYRKKYGMSFGEYMKPCGIGYKIED